MLCRPVGDYNDVQVGSEKKAEVKQSRLNALGRPEEEEEEEKGARAGAGIVSH